MYRILQRNYLVSAAFFVFFVLLGFTVVASQINYNSINKARRLKHATQVFLAPASLIEGFSFGFRNFLADIFWIQSVQYLVIEGLAKNSFMFEYLDIVTKLDNHFEYPYLLANLILPRYGSIEDARMLTERGMTSIPSSWQIPFYLGVQYRVLNKDYEQALKYLKIAATRPNKPEYIDSLIASYTLKSGDQVSARELFNAIYQTSTNQFVKESVKGWIKQIDHINLLQSLIFGYKRLYNTYPVTVDDLVAKKLILKIPEDVKNFSFVIDQASGTLMIE